MDIPPGIAFEICQKMTPEKSRTLQIIPDTIPGFPPEPFPRILSPISPKVSGNFQRFLQFLQEIRRFFQEIQQEFLKNFMHRWFQFFFQLINMDSFEYSSTVFFLNSSRDFSSKNYSINSTRDKFL